MCVRAEYLLLQFYRGLLRLARLGFVEQKHVISPMTGKLRALHKFRLAGHAKRFPKKVYLFEPGFCVQTA